MKRRVLSAGTRPRGAYLPPLLTTLALLCLGSPSWSAESSTAAAKAALLAQGINPHPRQLYLPRSQPLSAMAQLGEKLFHDRRLSGSQRLSCADCHSSEHAYGPPTDASVVLGGATGQLAGFRAVPSLRYLYRQPNFSIGPDTSGDNDQLNAEQRVQQQVSRAAGAVVARKSAQATQVAATNLVPQGGLFWDGRVNTLQQQANGPLYNPFEMDAGDQNTVLSKLQTASYAQDFRALFGDNIFQHAHLAVDEAMFAMARYQIENIDFHPFTSKYDAWLAGRARLSTEEMRGYQAFNDPKRGNCAACHLDQPTREGLPPLFTDFQYEALGVPRNPAIPANKDPKYFDLGICGPQRTDMNDQDKYCGMFLTPSLRNSATRQVFFHNGQYHTLEQVMDWYVNRDLQPARFYPKDAHGHVLKYDDLPTKYRRNIDTSDAPFDRHPGNAPALSAAEIKDVIAFLNTLTDGYQPPKP